MNNRSLPKNPALVAIDAALGRARQGALTVERHESGPGVSLRVGYGDHVSVLHPFWAGEGYRKDIEAALSAIRGADLPPSGTPVIVARRIPKPTRGLLDATGVSWVEEHGGASIYAPPGLAVVLEGSAASRADAPRLRWSETTGAVAEYVLGSHGGRARPANERPSLPGVVEIARALPVRASAVSGALRMFDAEGWTAKAGPERGPGARRELLDPRGMLGAWASWYRTTQAATVPAHRLIRNYDEFLDQELPGVWGETWWAVTGAAAAERRAPYLTSVPQVDLYVEAEVFDERAAMDRLLSGAGLRRVEAGARVRLLRADRFLRTLTRQAQSLPRQVPDIRLYGDLLRAGGRAEEAAEHLRETRIGF